ncbi:Nramp family divalent metal transporter [Demequina sp. SYSU T00039]|uniref:Nramp family divalent metal transporter n=1 Tax=Demequina lignilytica TaxID=3051663 RepID=A0AAW7M3W7_9MICO|nr:MULTISPECIES: Nramp family divalent metal transporter [unclassified Demequina]MDN4477095.1 Nramp family divalent metal transporter [Demequina sp. SYSU T00039-1]MDN4487268.1 Nramp family divalent metal transporter [Demequina sp. SYSU T00039]MDN4491519.1 Nramp family divalent metal transporter [Demequina sp. SYSU T00068]
MTQTLVERNRERAERNRGPVRRIVTLLGPAFVAAVAYVDPGNVAANLTAGAEHGYLLVWVLVASNLMAVLIQYTSAKLGLVTGRSMPELLRGRLRTRGRLAYWAQAEVVAAMTDLAEVIGGALALYLLFDIPLVLGGLIVGVVSLALLMIQNRRGQRHFEFVIMGLLAIIAIGFMAGLVVSDTDWGGAAEGLIPRFDGPSTVLLAASMLGATVMPHVIYLHSSLARDRHGVGHDKPRLRHLLHATKWDVAVSLVIAGSVNIAMLLLAAGSLRGVAGTDSIEGAYDAIGTALGPIIAGAFAVGLLASGLASTSVGCYAGAAIMGGLLHRRIPVWIRRSITLIPALVILGVGANPTWALVISQVVLSVGIPFAVIPLVRLTSDKAVMGEHANSTTTKVIAWTVVASIVALNLALLVLTFTGQV